MKPNAKQSHYKDDNNNNPLLSYIYYSEIIVFANPTLRAQGQI